MASYVKSFPTFREHLIPILLKCFKKIAEKGILPSSFYKATITLTPKPRISQKKKIINQYH